MLKHSRFLPLLLILLVSCRSSSNPVSTIKTIPLGTPVSTIFDPGSTYAFRLEVDTNGVIETIRTFNETVDSTHRAYDAGHTNISYWGDNSYGEMVNYRSDGIDVGFAPGLLLPYALTVWNVFPLDLYQFASKETFRSDTVYASGTSNEKISERDSVTMLGYEDQKVRSQTFSCLHLRATRSITVTDLQDNLSSTAALYYDYWYAPLLGYFIKQEVTSTQLGYHEIVTMIDFTQS